MDFFLKAVAIICGVLAILYILINLLLYLSIYVMLFFCNFRKKNNNTNSITKISTTELLIENIKVVSCGKKKCVHKIGHDCLYLAPRVWNSNEMDYRKASKYYMYEGSIREQQYPISTISSKYTRPTDYSAPYYVWKIYGEYFNSSTQSIKKCVLIVEDEFDIELDKYILDNGINKISYRYVKEYDDYSLGSVHSDEKKSIAQAFCITMDDVDKLIVYKEFVLLQAKYGEPYDDIENSTKELAEKALAYKYRDMNKIKVCWGILRTMKTGTFSRFLLPWGIIFLVAMIMSLIQMIRLKTGITDMLVPTLILAVVLIRIFFWIRSKLKRIIRIKNVKW